MIKTLSVLMTKGKRASDKYLYWNWPVIVLLKSLSAPKKSYNFVLLQSKTVLQSTIYIYYTLYILITLLTCIGVRRLIS